MHTHTSLAQGHMKIGAKDLLVSDSLKKGSSGDFRIGVDSEGKGYAVKVFNGPGMEPVDAEDIAQEASLIKAATGEEVTVAKHGKQTYLLSKLKDGDLDTLFCGIA